VHRELPYAEMPSLYRRASCMILASLPEWYWEEQFGMVLVEAMFSGLSVIASSAGAIPEVTRGAVPTVPPGDWPGLARALADGPLSRSPGSRVEYKPALVDHYRASSAAERLAGAYDKLLGR
jgi:glycosyltransferase involved in cell wall biosynthesis